MRRYPPLHSNSSSEEKKKDKDKAKLLEAMGTSKKNEEKRRGLDKRTPAQAAFEKMQEKRVRRVGSPGMPLIAGRGSPWMDSEARPGTHGGGSAVREP